MATTRCVLWMNCWVTNNEVNSPRVLNVSLWQHNWLDKQQNQQQKEEQKELEQKPKRNGTRHNSLSVALFDLIYMPMLAACGAQTDIRDGSHSTVDIYKLQKDDALSSWHWHWAPASCQTVRQTPARHGQRTTMTGPKQRPTLMSQENGASRNKRWENRTGKL